MTSAGMTFALSEVELARLGKRRKRSGTVRLVIGAGGLLFGVFWLFWGVIVFLTGMGFLTGLVVSLFGGVGPTLGAALVVASGVRRWREAEILGQLAIVAHHRRSITTLQAVEVTGADEADVTKSLAVAASAGAAQVVPASGVTEPIRGGGTALADYRKKKRRRALLLAIAAVPVLGFSTLWLVVGTAGIAAGEWAVGLLLLIPGGLFPLAGSIALAVRGLGHWRSSTEMGKVAATMALAPGTSPQELSRVLAISPGAANSALVEATQSGIIASASVDSVRVHGGAAPSVVTDATVPETWVGRVFGGVWRAGELIGRGGMGAIFRATHVQSGDVVALKVMLPELASSADALSRFEREARAVTQLGHPSIVRVHDFGYVDARVAYLVMDLLDGESLESRLQRVGTLHIEEALTITRQLADALAAAHGAGFLHRDLKPANVFLSRTSHGERAVLLDFGLVKSIDSASKSKRTVSGVVAGTPLYMSPEQARGEDLDVRSDVYGLAAVTYEMIAGVPPFFDKTVAEVYARLLREAAPAISSHAPRDCPAELEQTLARALSTDREQRPADMRAFAAELDAVALRSTQHAG